MKYCMKSIHSALLVLVMSPGHAAVVNNTANSGVTLGLDRSAVVTLDLFDPNLGRLTGVSFEYNMRAEAVYFLRSSGAITGNALANDDFVGFSVSSFGAGLTLFPVLRDRDGDAFSTTDIFGYSQFVEGSDSGSISRSVDGWTGSGTTDIGFRLQLGPSVATSANVFSDFRDVAYDVSVTVTYAFDPGPISPVPLPAGGLLLLSGLVGVLSLGCLKRRK